MRKILIFSIFVLFFSVHVNADAERVIDSANTLKKIIQKKEVPKELINRTSAIVVFPNVHQAGFFLGGMFGDGIVSRKNEFGWSEPTYVNIKGGNLGLQFGYQQSAMVLFVLNPTIANDMMSQKITLDLDASITIWNFGDNYADATDIKFTSDIYVFAVNKGIFAGISFGGAGISVDDEPTIYTDYAMQRWQEALSTL